MRQAADELRAELAGDTRDVRRQPQHQRLQRLHRRLRVLRLRRRASARPTPTSTTREEFVRRVARRARLRRDRDLHAVGHPPRLGAGGLPGLAAAGQGDRAASIHLHAYSPMEVAHMCDVSGLSPRAVFARLREAGPGLDARAPPPRCSTTACASGSAPTSCRSRAGWRSSRPRHRDGPALDRDGDVRPHRGAATSWPSTCASCASCRSAPAASPSSCRCRSSRSTRCSAARTGSRRSRARRTSSTPRCSGSRSAARSRACRRAG